MTDLKWETITPDIAQEYLSHNIENNRNASSDRVERIARDMAEGRWVSTPDAIKFNTAGKLIDGQHRLRAILRAQVDVTMLVARNTPDEAVYVIDTGMGRTTAQSLGIFNPTAKNRNTLVAVANMYNAYCNDVFTTTASTYNGRARMTTREALTFIEENQEELEHATAMGEVLARYLPLTPTVLGAVYMILARVDADAADEFFAHIKAGSSGRGEDDPIVTLTRRAYQDKINQRKVSPAVAFYMILRTWNAWRAGERLMKLQIGSAHRGYTQIPTPI